MTKGFHKIVEYHDKCQNCVYEHVDGADEPCNECLSNPARDGEESHTPINYKPKKEEK